MDIKSQVEKLLDIYKSCSCNGKYDKPIPHIIEEINKIYSKNKVTRRDKLEVKNLIEDWLIDKAIDTSYMVYLIHEYNIVTSLTYGRYDKYDIYDRQIGRIGIIHLQLPQIGRLYLILILIFHT